MSRRSLVVLIVAIIAVHVVLLWLILATNSAKRKLDETRRELEETKELSGVADYGADASQTEATSPAGRLSGDRTASAQPKDSGAAGGRTASAQPKDSGAKPSDPLADLPEVNDKPAPSVPSKTYVRKPRKAVSANLDYSGAARDNLSELKFVNLSTAGILVDMDTNKVLWAKNPSKPVPVASLTKIMTIMLAYEIAMDDSSPYTLESLIPVTPDAINTEPSKVNFKKGEMFTIRELLVAASVRSANDAAHLLAEHLGGGTTDKFIEDMNRRAKEVGMTHTTYFNAHGLPGKSKALDNQSSVEDIARLCFVFRQYPYLMELAGMRSAPFREKGTPDYMLLQNHNNLLPGAKYAAPGVNGIKTGFTNRAGFCVAATCERSGRHLLAVVTGFPSAADRDNFVRVLLDWGYAKIGVRKNASQSSSKNTSTKKGK